MMCLCMLKEREGWPVPRAMRTPSIELAPKFNSALRPDVFENNRISTIIKCLGPDWYCFGGLGWWWGGGGGRISTIIKLMVP